MFFTPTMHFVTPDPMLPAEIHRTLNVAFFYQCSIALLYCLWTRRILPTDRRHPTVKSIFLEQFRWMLVLHGAFYAVEMVVTDMLGGGTPMAVHHLVAVVIFTTIAVEPHGICTVSLLPFLLHSYFWVYSTGASFFLLTLYNWSLLLAGTVGVVLRAIQQPPVITWRIPAATLLEAGVNYFTYCWNYWGTYCPPVGEQTWMDCVRVVVGCGIVMAGVVVPAVKIAQKMSRTYIES
ncbi:hypothetical protein BC832DRAFT_441131 [Gaertneriomyces semiglobifer]|nr:hypothetical protein BC832DRAFT_441131 [Gaertneriomyces semiglobifer]